MFLPYYSFFNDFFELTLSYTTFFYFFLLLAFSWVYTFIYTSWSKGHLILSRSAHYCGLVIFTILYNLWIIFHIFLFFFSSKQFRLFNFWLEIVVIRNELFGNWLLKKSRRVVFDSGCWVIHLHSKIIIFFIALKLFFAIDKYFCKPS